MASMDDSQPLATRTGSHEPGVCNGSHNNVVVVAEKGAAVNIDVTPDTAMGTANATVAIHAALSPQRDAVGDAPVTSGSKKRKPQQQPQLYSYFRKPSSSTDSSAPVASSSSSSSSSAVAAASEEVKLLLPAPAGNARERTVKNSKLQLKSPENATADEGDDAEEVTHQSKRQRAPYKEGSSQKMKSVSPHDRALQFAKQGLIVSANKLFCPFCVETLSVKLSTIKNHIASEKHTANKKAGKAGTSRNQNVAKFLLEATSISSSTKWQCLARSGRMQCYDSVQRPPTGSFCMMLDEHS